MPAGQMYKKAGNKNNADKTKTFLSVAPRA